MEKFKSLKDHFLIAMPSLADPNFAQTVTYICEHSEHGAMGLIINHPLSIQFSEILSSMDISQQDSDSNQVPIFSGGPVQRERGFVLHTKTKETWESSLEISDKIQITTSKDILQAIAENNGPEDSIIVLGYAAWESGQLEKEMAENSWITSPCDPQILFNTPSHRRWRKAAELIGVNIDFLSTEVGHA